MYKVSQSAGYMRDSEKEFINAMLEQGHSDSEIRSAVWDKFGISRPTRAIWVYRKKQQYTERPNRTTK